MEGGRDALSSQKNKKRGKTPIGSRLTTLLSLYYTWGNQKKKKRHKTCEEEYKQRGHLAILRGFGYSGTSEEVSIKYGRYGLLCFFLSTMYTRIHMNIMHDPNIPHMNIMHDPNTPTFSHMSPSVSRIWASRVD